MIIIKAELSSFSTLMDEYARYCESPTVEIEDALQWWLESTQQRNFPNLSKMALNILSIPSMSSEPERVFSSINNMMNDKRMTMGMGTLEAFECLKSWLKLKDFVFEDSTHVGTINTETPAA